MGRRTRTEKNALSSKELELLRDWLRRLTPHELRQEYLEQIMRCRLEREVPEPQVVQRLVAIWKVLWQRRREMVGSKIHRAPFLH